MITVSLLFLALFKKSIGQTSCAQNCDSCYLDSCSQCSPGYHIRYGRCCPVLCESCTATSCTTCEKDSLLVSGVCEVCPVSCTGCANGVCLGCASGYYVSSTGTTCSKCADNCNSCSSATACWDCLEGFYSKSGVCTRCDDGC